MAENDVKQQVQAFYDQVGWQEVAAGQYQNAQYEDLRPVAAEYIRRCHLRVKRHLLPDGDLLLDAGSGPIQYPEYLEYSREYRYRVCADISMEGLREARKRIGDDASGGHGLFVVCDIANLPFKADAFDGVVSLHTIHHLPMEEHPQAYAELHRVLAPSRSGVIVNGWGSARLANLAARLVKWVNRKQAASESQAESKGDRSGPVELPSAAGLPSGTFVRKTTAAWLKNTVGSRIPLEILVWRTFSVNFLRAFIHPQTGGRFWLRLLFWLEERFPRWLGENGQYPLVVIWKK